MSVIEIVILGVVQGLTEFLPISSSGHLILVRLLFGISDIDGTSLDAFLHLGTLLALLVYYRQQWLKIAKSVVYFKNEAYTPERRLVVLLLIASIPAFVVGLWWPDELDQLLRTPSSLIWQILITAGVLLIGEWLPHKNRSYQSLTIKESIFLGISQAVAIIPAISRSGMTIATGRARGLTPQDAIHFSFLMAVPVLAGASLFSLGKLWQDAWPVEQLLIGLLVSGISGFVGIMLLNRLVRRVSISYFAGYLVLLAVTLALYGS